LEELKGIQLLEWWLKYLQSAKISWFQKNLLLAPIPHNPLNGLVQKKSAFIKRTAQSEQGFEFKVS
jgi:hypothetical protein